MLRPAWCSVLCLPLVVACSIANRQVESDASEGSGGSAGGGGGGGQGGGGGGGPAYDASCPSVSFTATATVPSVQLLIDRSVSMAYTLDTATGVSRYQAVSNAVFQVVGQLQAKVLFGATMFTQPSASTCLHLDSTASRKLMNLAQVQQLFQTLSPAGFTPTAAAVAQTAALFAASPPPAHSPPVIVLATDGLPNNCQTFNDPSADAVAAVADAHAAGIRTFVLGIAGVQGQFLQDVANAGQGVHPGQPNAPYFTANSSADLNLALQTLIGGVASCELAINGDVDPQFANSGTIKLDGALLHYGTEWDLVDSGTLRLKGAACTTFKTTPNAHVDATFPCTAVIL